MANKPKTAPKNPASTFVATAQKNWKPIAERLKADGVAPVTAYEAALAQMRGMHFDAELAQAFNVAYSEVQTDLMREKAETHGRRRA